MSLQLHIIPGDALTLESSLLPATAVVAYADVDGNGKVRPGRQLTNLGSAETPTTICAGPSGSAVQRIVKSVTLYNGHADTAADMVVRISAASVDYPVATKSIAAGVAETL